jgi:hypothetical protein
VSAAYRRADASAVVLALRARRLAELAAVELTHEVAMDVYTRRVRRAVFGATLVASAAALAVALPGDPQTPRTVILAGWIVALALAVLARDLAPLWLRDHLERRFRAEDDPVALDEQTAGGAVTAAARRLERWSIGLPLAGIMLLVPASLPAIGELDLAAIVTRFAPVQLALAILAWRFAGRLARRPYAGDIWRDGWLAVVWCGGVAVVSAMILAGPLVALFAGIAALFGAALFVPWVHEIAVILVERERDRLG